MRARDVLGAMVRRWYVVAVVCLVAACGMALLVADGGTFSTRTVVTFRLADSATLATDNGSDSESVIAFAGLVAAVVNEGRAPERYSSIDAPLYGAGIREGVVVSLRDEGTQWAPQFEVAAIELQIVGRTQAWVEGRQREVLAEIERVVAAHQATSAPDEAHIIAQVEPLTTRIDAITASRSTVLAAGGALAAATMIVAAWAAWRVDRAHAARRSDRTGRARRIDRKAVALS